MDESLEDLERRTKDVCTEWLKEACYRTTKNGISAGLQYMADRLASACREFPQDAGLYWAVAQACVTSFMQAYMETAQEAIRKKTIDSN